MFLVWMAVVREWGFELTNHPAYSFRLPPSDYLFRNMEKHLTGFQHSSDDIFDVNFFFVINQIKASPMEKVSGPRG